MNSSFSGLLVLLGFLLSFVYAETKHYALVATEEVVYPDCTPRLSVVINGTFPGPALYAMAGDHIFIRYVFMTANFLMLKGLQRSFRELNHPLAWNQSVWFPIRRWDSVRQSMAHSSGEVF